MSNQEDKQESLETLMREYFDLAQAFEWGELPPPVHRTIQVMGKILTVQARIMHDLHNRLEHNEQQLRAMRARALLRK